MYERRSRRRLLPVLAFLLAAAIQPQEVMAKKEALPELLEYRVTEHAPVINDRHDKAFQRALEATFRRAIIIALKESDAADRTARNFAAWQTSILSRASDFIASYRVLSQEIKEGHLTLTVQTRIYRARLAKAVKESAALSPLLPVNLLILVDTFPLAGSPDGEDIDAGHLAARSLEAEFLRRGAIIVPSPERLPWQHNEAGSSSENRLSLATVEGKRLGADYVVLGHLRPRADNLLVITAELISVQSERIVLSGSSPVELQDNKPPRENFLEPAKEMAELLSRKLSTRLARPPAGGPGRPEAPSP